MIIRDLIRKHEPSVPLPFVTPHLTFPRGLVFASLVLSLLLPIRSSTIVFDNIALITTMTTADDIVEEIKVVRQPHLKPQDATTVDASKLTALTPEVVRAC